MAQFIYDGAQFLDYDSLEHCLKEYEKENYVTFFKRDVKTIQKMIRRKTRKVKDLTQERMDRLKYYYVKYSCVYGGRLYKKRTSAGAGKKPRRSTTQRQDCPARINVLLSESQTYLRIVSMVTEHNHEISEEIYKKLPQNRKLAKEEEEKVQKLLELKVDRKLLLEQIREETGKLVTRRDLHNIAARSENAKEKASGTSTKRVRKAKPNKEPLIANQSTSANFVQVNADVPAASDSMAAYTPVTEATLTEDGATMSEIGAVVMEDHSYEYPTVFEIVAETPKVDSLDKRKESAEEQSKLEFLKEIELKKLKIEEEKLRLKSQKMRLLEEQNQLLKQLIDNQIMKNTV